MFQLVLNLVVLCSLNPELESFAYLKLFLFVRPMFNTKKIFTLTAGVATLLTAFMTVTSAFASTSSGISEISQFAPTPPSDDSEPYNDCAKLEGGNTMINLVAPITAKTVSTVEVRKCR
ncbi:MAG: hypothetical protein EAZ61_08240 [Oscillatoriales cyanobacterium]|nr:MAG: hypothetical protein EAZ61_08240 [Oscillatoriales cyanobacterium]